EQRRVEPYHYRRGDRAGVGVVAEAHGLHLADGEAAQLHRLARLEPPDAAVQRDPVFLRLLLRRGRHRLARETLEMLLRLARPGVHHDGRSRQHGAERRQVGEARLGALEPELRPRCEIFFDAIVEMGGDLDRAAILGQLDRVDLADLEAAVDDAGVAALLDAVDVVEADGDILAAARERAQRPPADQQRRGDGDAPDPARPAAAPDRRIGPATFSLDWCLVVHGRRNIAASHIWRGSKVFEAAMVSSDMSINAVAPQPALSEARPSNLTSGTKKTMVNGSVFDHRPSSATKRKILVFAARCRVERIRIERMHQPMAMILTSGMRMLVQKMIAPKGQMPLWNRSRTPVKMV